MTEYTNPQEVLVVSKVGADIKRGQPCHSARLLGVFMTFSDWMVPELRVSAAVELENSKRIIRSHAAHNPDKIIELACSAMEQTFMYQSITRKATKRIAELELTMLLSPPATPPDQSEQPCGLQALPPLVQRVLARWVPTCASCGNAACSTPPK